jgi:hypothetical protein
VVPLAEGAREIDLAESAGDLAALSPYDSDLFVKGGTIGALRTCPIVTVERLTLGDIAGLVTAVDGVGGTDSTALVGERMVDVDELAEIGGAGVGARPASFDGSVSLEKNDLMDDDRLTLAPDAATDGGTPDLMVLALDVETEIPLSRGVPGTSIARSLPLAIELAMLRVSLYTFTFAPADDAELLADWPL